MEELDNCSDLVAEYDAIAPNCRQARSAARWAVLRCPGRDPPGPLVPPAGHPAADPVVAGPMPRRAAADELVPSVGSVAGQCLQPGGGESCRPALPGRLRWRARRPARVPLSSSTGLIRAGYAVAGVVRVTEQPAARAAGFSHVIDSGYGPHIHLSGPCRGSH